MIGPDDDLEAVGYRLAWFSLMAYVSLIVVCSLVPARLDLDPAHVAHQWRMFIDGRRQWDWGRYAHSDLGANVLLYLPLGLLAPWPLLRRGRRLRGWLGVGLGILLSLSMELAQMLTRNRWSSLGDWTANSLGYVTGYTLMSFIILRYHLSPAIFLKFQSGISRPALGSALRLLYVVLVLALSLLPLDLSFNSQLMVARTIVGDQARIPLKGIYLNPLAPWGPSRWAAQGTAFVLFIPYGFLSIMSQSERGHYRFLRFGLAGLGLAALTEFLRIFVLSRTSDIVHCLAGGLGAMVGVGLACWWDRQTAPSPQGGSKDFHPENALVGAILLYSIFLLILNWWPFHFQSAAAALEKLALESQWIPFRSYAARRSLGDWRDGGQELGTFIPLGMLLASWLGQRFGAWRVWGRWGMALVMVGFLGIFLELSQCLIVGRVVDSTDIVSHVLGGVAGYGLGALFLNPNPPSTSEAS